MPTRSGHAVWRGDLKTGQGTLGVQSKLVEDAAYSFPSRFEEGTGTNPEELIGAAHAACFAMALSNIMGEDDIVPDKIDAKSTIHLDMSDGPKIVKAHIEVTIKADADESRIMDAAGKAKEGCPVSQLLDCEITMDAKVA